MNQKYEPVIGLEVHAQLLTTSKAFCSCTTQFGNNPNSNTCPVCLGHPGVLPVLNRNHVEFIIRMGLATHCRIAPKSIFARKNYFYPDLPKGYQISQFEEPICCDGWLDIEPEKNLKKKIGITRIHMEEDAGKSIHDQDPDTLVDVNRCGVPLIEIVSEPDIRTPKEAYLYLATIKQIVTYLGICDGNMEEGSLRCDANVSVRLRGAEKFGTRVEVKNMNSFRNVEHAIEYEINRQINVLEEGGTIVQETLLWDADRNMATPMRSKEQAHDYRYFPDPDLVPIFVDEPWIDDIKKTLPEMPWLRRDRYVSTYALPEYDADVLTVEKATADYFEESLAVLTSQSPENVKYASNWIMTEVMRVVKERQVSIREFPVTPSSLGKMINMITDGTISGKIAKDVFEEMVTTGGDPDAIVQKKGLVQISDAGSIEPVIDRILSENPAQVESYLGGKQQVFGFFVGETMKATKGKANPNLVNEILRRRLDEMKR
jgi:aspartyl-tRNA(Asn)/glutamyl-tRNA(Gln) amidotransferase subunit B